MRAITTFKTMVFARFNCFEFSFFSQFYLLLKRAKIGHARQLVLFSFCYALPRATAFQLHLRFSSACASLPHAASSCRVCKTAQAPFSPVAPAAPFLQPLSFELPAAPSVSQLAAREIFQLRRRSSQLPAAPSFKCQLPARHNVPASSFQLPARTDLKGPGTRQMSGERTAAHGRARPPDAWERSPTLSVCIIAQNGRFCQEKDLDAHI